MAGFFMWVATFFTMATLWNILGSVWSRRNDKDFRQVQREHCQRLCKDISSLENCLNAMKAFPKKKVLNRNQCVHLFGKLIVALKGIKEILSSATEDFKFQCIFEELCYLQKKVEIVGKQCIEQEQWYHSAIFQLQNKETFRELLLDVKCCYKTVCEMYLFCHPNQSNDVLPIEFDATTNEQVLEDAQALKEKLEHILQVEVSTDYEIVQHLLWRLKNLDRVDGGDLNELEVPHDFKPPKLIQKIGEGGNGDVYKSKWLGLPCATKALKGNLECLMIFRKEAGILACLSHPNLVQFFGCGITKNVEEVPNEDEIGKMCSVMTMKSSLFQMLRNVIPLFGKPNEVDGNRKEDETEKLHLVMELMETSLSQVLKKAKRPLPYLVALDIMHQIAKGVNYLHDMQVAHLDLKPENILSSSIPMEDLDPCHIFKVTDYGTCELEVCSNPKPLEILEPLKCPVGTLGYMSPEMIKGSKSLYRFQADVWSFAMICSEILTGKVPYSDLKPRDFYEGIQGTCGHHLRPDLPDNCEGLTNLIRECWSQDPLQRPTFSNICERLTSLKKSFLKGECCTSRNSKSIENDVSRVDKLKVFSKDVPVDIDLQLSKAKGLLKQNYIGIVGMGGIGKTTLAKAIFDDKTINSSYQASCFVAECKSYQSSYEILCTILPKFGNNQKPKNLGDAQKMMKELLVAKKVLLILDDIKDEAQVQDIVPLNFVQGKKGTNILLTTRKWSTIKSFVDTKGRLDVELLDEKAAIMLFTTHLSWGEAPLSRDFEALRKRVVKACNGLPLSLKVMGSFLHNKKRLRCWERALQRLARGRNLDGDEEIWNTLKVSYDGLSTDVEKGIFLDVACFFCRDVYPSGVSKETILFMWSKEGVLPMGELDKLIDMSLMKVSEDGILEMHDQLRDMGRMIAKGTRIWKASMIPHNGFSSKNAKVLEGIFWQGTMVKEDFNFDFEKLRVLIFVTSASNLVAHIEHLDLLILFAAQCSKLEALIIEISRDWDGLQRTVPTSTRRALQKKISYLCGTCLSLKILHLEGFRFLEQISHKFASSHTLLQLNLSFCSNLEAFLKKMENLSSLTSLDLRWCKNLEALSKELGNLSSLTTLDLEGCCYLKALPEEVGNLFFLTTFNLKGCWRLKALPKKVENLSSLTSLNLERCLSLKALPKEVGNLSSLTTLYLIYCSSLKALPKQLGDLSSLTTLNLKACFNLEALPKQLGNLSSLTTLNLERCESLKALPKEVGNFSSLTTLNLKLCSTLKVLPKEVGNLSSLTTINLERCSTLEVLPKEVGNLSSLTTLNLNWCSSLKVLPNEVGNLSLLTTFNLKGCKSLKFLPKEVGNFSSLTTLDLEQCSSLKVLPKEVENLSSLTILDLIWCESLEALPEELGNLSSLTTLNLMVCSSLKVLPKEVGNLSSLTTLDLRQCESLKALPKEVENLSSLTTLDLGWCESLEVLPKEVGNLSSLTTLDLGWCKSLEVLPKEVGNLSSLTTLNLERCESLKALPKEVGNLFLLTTLNLKGCSTLKVLPKEVGNLSSLTTLNLERCSTLEVLPKEVGNLSSLTTLNLKWCSSLKVLPNEVGNLSLLTTFNLKGCESLKFLPKEIKNLSSLTILNLKECLSLKALSKGSGELVFFDHS